LGTKEISGTSFGDMTLSDISNIEINEGALQTGDILIYNEDTRKWMSADFSAIAETMVGATARTDGSSGIVPAPKAGDQNMFLRGDGTWSPVTSDNFEFLTDIVTTLVGGDYSKSARDIATEEVAAVVAEAPESFDTLKEIADWIQSHPSDASDLNSRVADLEEDLVAVNGDITSLNSRVTALENSSFLGDINAAILALQQKDSELESSISDLDNRLKWQNL